jgi:exopolysaccharide biosynthesis polyprenyl glycosylphosphotransferase
METTSVDANSLAKRLGAVRSESAWRSLFTGMQWRLHTAVLILGDVLMVGLAFRAAYFVRFEMAIWPFRPNSLPSIGHYQGLVLVLIPIWLAIFAFAGLYDRSKLLGGTAEYALVFHSTLIGMFVVIAAGFLDPDFIIARGWLLLAWALGFVLTAVGRFVVRRVVYSMRAHGFFLASAVIVGANNEGLSLAEQLIGWKDSGLNLVGFVDKKLPVGTHVYRGLPVLGNVESLDSLIDQYGIEELILASSAFSARDKVIELFQRYGVSGRIHLRMSSGLYEIMTTGLTVQEFAYVPLVGINPVRLTGVDQVLKTALDYCLTVPGLIVISPLLLVIALAVKLDSPGPVIHLRRVMGLNGRQINAYKFRTMHVNGDEILRRHPELGSELASNHKLKKDPRVTRLGAFLRRTSLDELPQLFNVLKGDMSLVGPRMIAPEETEKYSKWDMNLLTVRPGITGLWQVRGRSDISYEERVRLDMHYIRNWTIWYDLQILFQTLPAVIRGRGAY